MEKKVKAAVLAAYKITGCNDYARLDVRLTKDNKIFVLEVNPNPDLTESVSFMQSAEHIGLSFGETLSKIVDYALRRPAPSKPVVQKVKDEVSDKLMP